MEGNDDKIWRIAETLETVFGDLLFEHSAKFFEARMEFHTGEEGLSADEASKQIKALMVESLEGLTPLARGFTEKFGPSAKIRIHVFEKIFYNVLWTEFDDTYLGLGEEENRDRFIQSVRTFISQADATPSNFNKAYFLFLEAEAHRFVDPDLLDSLSNQADDDGSGGGAAGSGTAPATSSGSTPPVTPTPAGSSGASAAGVEVVDLSTRHMKGERVRHLVSNTSPSSSAISGFVSISETSAADNFIVYTSVTGFDQSQAAMVMSGTDIGIYSSLMSSQTAMGYATGMMPAQMITPVFK